MGNTNIKYQEIDYPNGNSYRGEMKGKMRHGQGTYRWTDGAVYVGDWEQNRQHGRGKMEFPNGNLYVGEFYRNNINGQGTLTTSNNERIEGKWTFMGRADNIPNAHNQPVGRYTLNVVVSDLNSNTKQGYVGLATVHLSSGLVVLPGMQDPKAFILPVAVAIAVADDNDPSVAKTDGASAPPANADAAPIVATPIQPTSALEQQHKSSLMYGAHDRALEKKEPNNPKKHNLLNPKLYF